MRICTNLECDWVGETDTPLCPECSEHTVEMWEPGFWDEVRIWIGSIAFNIYLWANRMSEEEYFDILAAELADEHAHL